ncbi:acetyl-CoA carboxylase, biotin carboxyl carrier protein [Cyanobium sp. PCC 7001]|uniref:acetyl-CoA carboxylase biotin carboxyl carrier protein n=1 Tax=Cyanobium sp. PCC 7001 TaxID=180281 RepID=UPI0001804C9A|nr:acetyl-CoA carboxylase biotin carboxyl carrier protein [Cyanobium sp. PCC 7001]EDY39718.1 acetyl-CoA carboxylase, biotin carboxyl carrier protein [Cyanobium sp. PCC 7001]
MQLDHDQLHKLLALLGDSDIQELRLEGDDFRLEVRRNLPGSAPVAVMAPAPAVQTQPPAPAPAAAPPSPSAPPPAAAASRSDLVEITAPMVATFYRAPAPGEPNFVELGARIKVGQTICILEAMKLMNELEAEVSGEVVEILVENGTPVEFGQVLMRVKPA